MFLWYQIKWFFLQTSLTFTSSGFFLRQKHDHTQHLEQKLFFYGLFMFILKICKKSLTDVDNDPNWCFELNSTLVWHIVNSLVIIDFSLPTVLWPFIQYSPTFILNASDPRDIFFSPTKQFLLDWCGFWTPMCLKQFAFFVQSHLASIIWTKVYIHGSILDMVMVLENIYQSSIVYVPHLFYWISLKCNIWCIQYKYKCNIGTLDLYKEQYCHKCSTPVWPPSPPSSSPV